MNTKEQIDELFCGILKQRQKVNLERFEIDNLMKIRKVKLQFYFKEKFAELLPLLKELDISNKGRKLNNLPVSKCMKSPKKVKLQGRILSKATILEMSVSGIADFLKVEAYKLNKVLLRKGILITNYNDKLSHDEINCIYDILNKWYNLIPLDVKKKTPPKIGEKVSKKKKFDLTLLISDIQNHSIEYIAQFVGQKTDRIIYILNSNGISNVNKDSVLSTSDIMLIYDYLNNAFNVYIRKCEKEKEEKNYKGITKRIVERHKPSLGLEGDYRRLIYIPTKT